MEKALLCLTSLLIAQIAYAQDIRKPVKIGVLTDMSGFASSVSGAGSVLAAQMAIEDAGGQVLGFPIELVSADNQSKPDVASAIAMRWYDRDGVTAIADLPPSSVALAVQAISKTRQKIALFSTAGAGDLIGKQCSEFGFQWTFGSSALARTLTHAVLDSGGKSWFYITSDFAFGRSIEDESRKIVVAAGGEVKGKVYHPIDAADMSSFILQAQSSGAQVIALANTASTAVTSVLQAFEFGIAQSGQRLVGMALFLSDVHSIGIEKAEGLLVAESFYWDMNDTTRAWSKRFGDRLNGRMPTMTQAGVYSAVAHYLKAVAAAGTVDGAAVAKAMRDIPVNDFMTDNARIRKDGWVERDFYLFQVKSKTESVGPWDLYKMLRKVSRLEAAPPERGNGCSLVD